MIEAEFLVPNTLIEFNFFFRRCHVWSFLSDDCELKHSVLVQINIENQIWNIFKKLDDPSRGSSHFLAYNFGSYKKVNDTFLELLSYGRTWYKNKN